MIGLCEYCGLKYADCKGNKDLEKLKCEYYKKRPVQNVKQMAERIAELEIKLKDSAEVVRCKDCKYRGIIDYPVCCESTDEWFCADGERKGGDE